MGIAEMDRKAARVAVRSAGARSINRGNVAFAFPNLQSTICNLQFSAGA